MSIVPFAGKDPTESQFIKFRWREPKKATTKKKRKPVVVAETEQGRERARNVFRRRGVPVWARHVIEEVATRTGVSLGLIASERKYHHVVHARNEAIYILKDRMAVLSTPTLGKWFNRDHTSIMHSIASHSERTGAPELTGYGLHRARKRNAAFNAWKRKQAKTREAA